MAVDVGALRRTLATYRGTGPSSRAFVTARVAVAPLGALDPELRGLRGRVLSVGCGFAVLERYLAEINPHVTVEGVDIDGGRVRVARATAERSPRVDVSEADVTQMNSTGALFDAVLAIDLLHHVPADGQAAMLAALAGCLVPGGTLLLKDIDVEPRWKYLFNRGHDRVVAGPDPIHCHSSEEAARMLSDAGLEPGVPRRLHRFGPYPHYLVTATRP